MSLHNEMSTRAEERARREKFQTSNSFTLRRYGPLEEGINIQCDGLDLSDPRKMYVAVGTHRVSRDKGFGCSIFKRGAGREIRRVFPIKIVREGKRTFYRLRNPGNGELRYSVINVFFRTPELNAIVVNDQTLHVHVGFSTHVGSVIASTANEALIILYDGEEMEFFFPDGHVRVFEQEGTKLVEKNLTPQTMYRIRIEDAKRRLISAKAIEDVRMRDKQVQYVLLGMVDLFHLTSRNRGNGRALRELLIQGFFLTLAKDDVDSILWRLIDVFRRVDCTHIREFRNAQQKLLYEQATCR